MGEELPRKGNSRYEGPKAGRCLEWEDQGRRSTMIAETEKQGEGGKEMQVVRGWDQRLNVIVQQGGGHSRFQIIAWLISGFRRVSV